MANRAGWMQEHTKLQHHSINDQYYRIALVLLPENANHEDIIFVEDLGFSQGCFPALSQ